MTVRYQQDVEVERRRDFGGLVSVLSRRFLVGAGLIRQLAPKGGEAIDTKVNIDRRLASHPCSLGPASHQASLRGHSVMSHDLFS
jgi:hypothetical protein